jgi:hypothetical protein
MPGLLGGNKSKIWLSVVLLLAAGALFYYQFRGSGGLDDEVNFICVATGKMYWVDREEAPTIPVKNPKTGDKTLLPCYLKDGVLHVSPRYRDDLMKLGEKNQYVDTDTLAGRTAP